MLERPGSSSGNAATDPLADLLAEVRQAPKIPLPRPPELVRSQTTPWPTSLASPEHPSSQQTSRPILKKRHSTYIRPLERSTSPIPELPPHRPPRNPARGSSAADSQSPARPPKVKSRSRPSTATSTREEVTPWEMQPGPDSSRARSTAPSIKSKSSSAGLSTGPVQEVTPWELYPVPASLPSTKPPSSNSNLVLSPTPSAPSPRSLHASKATGLTEDVAPWELSPGPAPGPPSAAPSFMDDYHPEPTPTSLKSRSKPPSLLSEPNSATYRLSTATGPTEEVTPWELEPTPEAAPLTEEPPPRARQRNSLTMSKAQLEEVMPWELYPPPPLPSVGSGSSSIKNGKTGIQSARNSTSKPLGEFALLRRRRSTGSRASKTRSNSQALKKDSRGPPGLSLNGLGDEDAPSGPKTAKSSAISSTDTYYSGLPSGQSILNAEGAAPSSAKHLNTSPKFSTADRTILEELKRNIHARNAQFVMKGVGVHLTDGTISPGKKHHPFVAKDVPYPRSYEREVVDLDIWETLFCQDICESVTFHVFETPPLRVLDIGCGTGTWILNCAQHWKETHFVGLDIVPLHPDLHQVGSPDLASRITWTQANFLDGLPFPNEEFDLVHFKRIALGVPEDKWDFLFDEISRILKPGGAIEGIEEDLFFPGRPAQQEDEDSDFDKGSVLSRSSSVTSGGGRRDVPSVIQEDRGEDDGQELLPSSDKSIIMPTPSTVMAFPKTPTNPKRPELRVTTGEGEGLRPDDLNDLTSQASTTPPGSPKGYITLIPPHSRSSARPLLYVKASQGSSGHSIFASTSPPKHSSFFSSSAVSLLNSLTHTTHTAHSDSDHSHSMFRRRRSSSNLTHHSTTSNHAPHPPAQHHHAHHTNSLLEHDDVPPPLPRPNANKTLPFLLRTPAKAPINPRDHSLLEYIYKETLASRFINTSPLTLLTSYMEYHFNDARTHPSIMMTFPPVPKPSDEPDNFAPSSGAWRPDSPVRSTLSRTSVPHTDPTALIQPNGELVEEHRWLDMRSLLLHLSPFIYLDDSRTYSVSPSGKKMYHVVRQGVDKTNGAHGPPKSRIPNKTLHVDLRTLNLHLLLRVREILGMSESMWEWVRETQLAAQQQEAAASKRLGAHSGGRGHSLDIHRNSGVPSQISSTPNDHKAAVRNLTREDFNQMLLFFEMDMQDQAAIHNTLKERFQWKVIDTDPSQNRKIFNTACEKYEKWQKSEQQYYHQQQQHQHRPASPTSFRPSRQSLQLHHGRESYAEAPMSRNRSNSQTTSVHRPGTANGTNGLHVAPQMGQSHSMGSTHRSEPSVQFSVPKTLAEVPPHEKLSRAVAVFVAWKAQDPPASAK